MVQTKNLASVPIVMKVKSTKKDRYLLKRQDPLLAPAGRQPASIGPEQGGRRTPVLGADPPTPPLPGSTVEDKGRMPPVEIPPPTA
jgi:hypothetical protein